MPSSQRGREPAGLVLPGAGLTCCIRSTHLPDTTQPCGPLNGHSFQHWLFCFKEKLMCCGALPTLY